MATQTMAILADTGEFPGAVLAILARKDFRLLFVTEEVEEKTLRSKMKKHKITVEFDFISCERDGCWEADVIVLYPPHSPSSPVIQKMREVATQKLVLAISHEKETARTVVLSELLPHSQVVEIHLKKGVTLDFDAEEAIQRILQAAGH